MVSGSRRTRKASATALFIFLLNGSNELLHLSSSLVVDKGTAPFSYPGCGIVKAPTRVRASTSFQAAYPNQIVFGRIDHLDGIEETGKIRDILIKPSEKKGRKLLFGCPFAKLLGASSVRLRASWLKRDVVGQRQTENTPNVCFGS